VLAAGGLTLIAAEGGGGAGFNPFGCPPWQGRRCSGLSGCWEGPIIFLFALAKKPLQLMDSNRFSFGFELGGRPNLLCCGLFLPRFWT